MAIDTKILDVRSFGAKGDNIQEDSTFINNAITSALSKGQDLFFPSGTYKCNSFITGQTYSVKIDQTGVKKIRIFGEGGTKITTNNTSGMIFFVYYQCKDTVIENIFFESTHGLTQNQTNAFFLAGTGENAIQNFTFRNCRFEGFSTAVSFQGVKGLTIENCVFEAPLGHDNAQNNAQPAVFVGMGDNNNGQCYDIKILNNLVNGYTGADITTTVTQRPMDGFIYGPAYGIQIIGNITRNLCEEHIAVAPVVTFSGLTYPTLISNNQFYQGLPSGCTKSGSPLISNYGVRADCNNVTISNNEFIDYTQGVLIYPLGYPNLKQHTFNVNANKFYSPRSSMYNVTEAIKIHSPTGNTTYNVNVSNNFIDIDGIQLKQYTNVIAMYNLNKVSFSNNNIFKQNVNVNGFGLVDIISGTCTNIITYNNNVF